MMSRITFAAGLALSLLLPVSAFAYVTPDEGLDESNFSTRFVEPPPSRRDIQSVANAQQQRSAERRAAEQAALAAKDKPAEEPTHAAPAEEPTVADPADTPDSSIDISNILTPEELRLLARIRDTQHSPASADDEVLHSGAPLTETGPTTVLITLAIGGAIGETWRRVRKMERQ